MATDDGSNKFKGTAHEFLQAIYQSEKFPMDLRHDAAKAAAKFETPAMQAIDSKVEEQITHIVRMPHPAADLAEWTRLYGGRSQPNPEADARLAAKAATAPDRLPGA